MKAYSLRSSDASEAPTIDTVCDDAKVNYMNNTVEDTNSIEVGESMKEDPTLQCSSVPRAMRQADSKG